MSPTEAADIQKAMEESLKPSGTHPGHPMTGVSIKEPESRKLKQLPETIGKGKSVATEEQAAHTLLHISSPASKTKDLQYEFKKRSPESSKPNVALTEDTQEQSQSQELFIESSDLELEFKASNVEEKSPVTVVSDTILDKSTRDSPPHDLAHTTEHHTSLQDDFVASIYPGVQVNLKLESDEQGLTIEPDSSTGTLSSFNN